jgi:DNA-nicking Smr family endonuclease
MSEGQGMALAKDPPEKEVEAPEEPIVIPITGELDLHTFSPRELAPLLEDYLWACQERGILEVRIIHGKGTGQLKARVRSLLAKNPQVVAMTDAEAERGGWGATLVTLKPLK